MCTTIDGCKRCPIPRDLEEARKANNLELVNLLMGLCRLRMTGKIAISPPQELKASRTHL